MKNLSIFDFDNTLFFTPESKEGREIYKNKTGQEWPYPGWWGRKESLDTDIFDIPLNKVVYDRYISSKGDYLVLATGRLSKLTDQVSSILQKHGLKFDEVHLNPGMDTYKFKSDLFEKLIYKIRPDKVFIYDDRDTHLIRFKDWSEKQPCDVEIIDVKNLK